MTNFDLTRRAFGSAAVGSAAVALAACGSDVGEPGAAAGDGSPTPSESSGGAPGDALVAADQVPVGGGVILKDSEVVVVQPAEGDFKGFSAICTHQGCLVGEVADNQISCPCHGSVFSAEDGSVLQGPAGSPLPDVEVEVVAGEVTRA